VYVGTVAELKKILFGGIKHKIKFLSNFPFVYIPRRVHSSPKPDESIPTGLNLSRSKLSKASLPYSGSLCNRNEWIP